MKNVEIEKHELVPKHTLLSAAEKEELLKKYGVSLRQLPRMLVADPAVAKLGCNVGDIVKIERKSQTAGETVYYRVVVK